MQDYEIVFSGRVYILFLTLPFGKQHLTNFNDQESLFFFINDQKDL